jgi:transposase
MLPEGTDGPQQSSRSAGPLEFAHVLFMDIVSYSLLPIDHQSEVIQQLQDIVRGLPDFEAALAADELICLPAGDGMALAFFGDPTAPLRCARQIAIALKKNPRFELRMGIHTGPVYRVADVNTNRNVAGGGINFAQRVMDCGDGGHILVSKALADVLQQLSAWKAAIHDLGEHEVKHGVRIHLFNVFTDEFGNSQIPSKLARPAAQRLAVYVATTTSDLDDQRKAVINQLNAWGYPVLPLKPLPVESDSFRSSLDSAIAECALSVHLISGQRGMIPEGEERSIIGVQYEAAQSRRVERVAWILPGTEPHPTVLASLNAGPQEGLDRLEGQTIEDLKDVLESKLKRLQGEALTLKSTGDRANIYLVCDEIDHPHVEEPPNDNDTHRQRALKLESYLSSRGFVVWMPPVNMPEKRQREKDHRETLKLSDAVVLYWGAADESWFRENLRSLTKARTNRSNRPFSAEAIYFSCPRRSEKAQYKGHLELAFEQFEDFRPEALKPFIQLLNRKGGAPPS